MNGHQSITYQISKEDYLELFNLLTDQSHRRHFNTNRNDFSNPLRAVDNVVIKPSSANHEQEIITTVEESYSISRLLDLENEDEAFSKTSDLELSDEEVIEMENTSSQEVEHPSIITISDDDDDDDVILIEDDHEETERVQKKGKDLDEVYETFRKKCRELSQKSTKCEESKKGLVDYSDSSDLDSPSKEVTKKKKKKRSSSPLPQKSRPLKMRLKYEALDFKEIRRLEDQFYCEICEIALNNLEVFTSHMNGKRHQKKWKSINLPEAVIKTIPSSPVQELDRYPKPPAGVMRIQANEYAKLQIIIEEKMKSSFLYSGDYSTLIDLNSVFEIQAMDEIKYYCSRCDSPCSSNSILPHLTGFKHRLNNFKWFFPTEHEAIKDSPKYKIEGRVNGILRELQRRRGIGTMVVEKDVHLTESGSQYSERRVEESTSKDMAVPSTSYRNIDVPFEEIYSKSTIPDESRSGFFCKFCKAHMMDKRMWDQHIRGRRHLKNVQKMPGMYPSKLKTVSVDIKRTRLSEKIKRVHEPVVGLEQIEELQNHETKSETYKCFLCGGCFSDLMIIEHLLTTKHRLNYLEFREHPDILDMDDTISESELSIIVKRICGKLEAVEGRGKPKVQVTKDSLSVI